MSDETKIAGNQVYGYVCPDCGMDIEWDDTDLEMLKGYCACEDRGWTATPTGWVLVFEDF